MEKTYIVEYTKQMEVVGKCTLTRKMNQVELGELLLLPRVILLSVDKPKVQYIPKKKKVRIHDI